MPFTSLLPSLVLVCPSNWGSITLTEMTAVSPSLRSSPERLASFSLSIFSLRASSFIARVIAERKPATWVPPSMVLMRLTKPKSLSI